MSVILESQPGDEIICIADFHVSPEGDGFSWDTSRQVRVGERVRFLGARVNPHFHDRPNGWMVVFEANGNRFAASQSYFVTEECWHGIQEFLSGKAPEIKAPLAQSDAHSLPPSSRR